jgi:hypothetical protein
VVLDQDMTEIASRSLRAPHLARAFAEGQPQDFRLAEFGPDFVCE